MRVVTWNCRRAKPSSLAWQYLLDLDPDIALLQEVMGLPAPVSERWSHRLSSPAKKDGGVQKFRSAILVRGRFLEPIGLRAREPWVNGLLEHFADNLPAWRIETASGKLLSVVNVYSPAWPVNRKMLDGMDTKGVQLELNKELWVADLLWAALRTEQLVRDPWVIGGDFNSSETFDSWPGGPRGNREFLDRMSAIGLSECLRESQGAQTPTFRNPRGGAVVHQMDHLFVSEPLRTSLLACQTGEPEVVFGSSLSDHLPIISNFANFG